VNFNGDPVSLRASAAAAVATAGAPAQRRTDVYIARRISAGQTNKRMLLSTAGSAG